MTPREALQQVRDLFDATHWGKGHYVRQTSDKVKFCLVGGLMHVSGRTQLNYDCTTYWFSVGGGNQELLDDLIELVANAIPGGPVISESSIVEFNDHTSTRLEDVLKVLDRAIENAPA
jgi:hypothetical protein